MVVMGKMTFKHEMLSEPTFAFVDIETTGGNAQRDRITEIGIRFWRNGAVVGEWQTLLNPEARISGFIERLTGISNAMVASAPRFETIADELERHLDGCIFVAHNARFDYGFIKSEFRRLGRLFSARVLCTVRLSRALYPEAERHNMDALIARHGLPAVERHRAMGDVTAMLAFFEHTLLEQGEDTVGATINRLLQRPSTPSNVPAEMLADLPAGPVCTGFMEITMCCCMWAKAPIFASGWPRIFPVIIRVAVESGCPKACAGWNTPKLPES